MHEELQRLPHSERPADGGSALQLLRLPELTSSLDLVPRELSQRARVRKYKVTARCLVTGTMAARLSGD